MDRTAIRQTLKELLENDNGKIYDDFDNSTDLRQGLGLDSVAVISLVVQVEDRFRIVLKNEELERVMTIGNLLDLLQSKLPAAQAA